MLLFLFNLLIFNYLIVFKYDVQHVIFNCEIPLLSEISSTYNFECVLRTFQYWVSLKKPVSLLIQASVLWIAICINSWGVYNDNIDAINNYLIHCFLFLKVSFWTWFRISLNCFSIVMRNWIDTESNSVQASQHEIPLFIGISSTYNFVFALWACQNWVSLKKPYR